MTQEVEDELRKLSTPQSALVISQRLYGDDATAKQVNPSLYKLLSQKKAVRYLNKPPTWIHISRDPLAVQILSVLTSQPLDWKEIQAKLDNIKRKDINSRLYSLESNSMVEKHPPKTGKRPSWTKN